MEVLTILSFTSTSFIRGVYLNITDDSLLELTEEDFNVTLSLVDPEVDRRIIMMPESAVVTIFDNDSEEVLAHS